MAYKLNQYQIDLINEKLPPQFAALKYRYPVSIFNAAHHWDKPKYPQGYVPKRIAIYYDELPSSPSISWSDGKLNYVRIEEIPIDPDVTQVEVDDIWTYIRVQGQVVLDRTEGIQFPPELTQQELMLSRILHSMSSGNFKEFTS
jgi:hypothetical protein